MVKAWIYFGSWDLIEWPHTQIPRTGEIVYLGGDVYLVTRVDWIKMNGEDLEINIKVELAPDGT